MNTFQRYVTENARWFRGVAKETELSLLEAERNLGVKLPEDLRWLLVNYGYWHATGIQSLDETVDVSLKARKYLNLPARYLVLNDRQDAGAYLLDTVPCSDTNEPKVYDVAWESIPNRIDEEITFDSLLKYVQDVLEVERDIIVDEDVDFVPSGLP